MISIVILWKNHLWAIFFIQVTIKGFLIFMNGNHYPWYDIMKENIFFSLSDFDT